MNYYIKMFLFSLIGLETLPSFAKSALSVSEEKIEVSKPALFPETILSFEDGFLLGSFRDGKIYRVDQKGNAKVFVEHEKLHSIMGMAIDQKRNHLLVLNSDLGASVKSTPQSTKKTAGLAIFKLSTRELENYIDLVSLLPNQEHLANGLAVDSAGNAYITDSFSETVYKVDEKGNASIFLQNKAFSGQGIALNGVVVHPAGYLLVVKKDSGDLFKIPIKNPKKFSKVKMPPLFGGDGVILLNSTEVVVISNMVPDHPINSAFLIESKDGWKTAAIIQSQEIGPVYPTTGTVKEGMIYLLHSNLGDLVKAPADEKEKLKNKATIIKIGSTPGNIPRFKAVAFDYFVIFDPNSVIQEVEKVFPGKGMEFTKMWRTKQFEYGFLRSITNRHEDFFKVTESALDYTIEAMKLKPTPEEHARLLNAYLNLKPWPDAVEGLKKLKASGLKIITIANFSKKMLKSNADNSRITELFDELLSTEINGTYKPDGRAYELGLKRLKLKKSEVVFAAFGGWDAYGAKAFGYPTFWVNRFGLPEEKLGITADGTSSGFAGLLDYVFRKPGN
jgi:2-haloacid dehalogenase